MNWQAIFVGLRLAAFNAEDTMPVTQTLDNPFRVAAMDELGSMPIAGILGTYQANLDELAMLEKEPWTVPGQLMREKCKWRLHLYAALEREVARIVGASHEG